MVGVGEGFGCLSWPVLIEEWSMYRLDALRRILDEECSDVSISSSLELHVLVLRCLELLPLAGKDRGESVSSLEGLLALVHLLFAEGGSTSISSTLAR